MASASQIKAGEAFWEVTIRDKYSQGLRQAQSKMAAFGASVSAIGSTAAIAGAAIAAGVAAVATGTYAVISKSVSTFLGISEQMRQFTGNANPKAEGLTDAWGEFKAVLSAVFFIIGDAVAGPLTNLIKSLTEGTLRLAQFGVALANGGIIQVFAAMTLAIRALWDAMLMGLQESLRAAVKGIVSIIMFEVNGIALIIKTWEDLLSKITGKPVDLGSSFIKGAIGALGAAIPFAVPIGDPAKLAAELAAALGALRGLGGIGNGSLNQPRLPGLAHLGGSAGTFSSRGASLLGIGSGGGLKTSDDELHKQMERLIGVVELLTGVKFK